jgi:hypothetical protein
MQTTNRIFALTFARMFIAFFVLLSMSAGCGAVASADRDQQPNQQG